MKGKYLDIRVTSGGKGMNHAVEQLSNRAISTVLACVCSWKFWMECRRGWIQSSSFWMELERGDLEMLLLDDLLETVDLELLLLDGFLLL